MKMKVKNFLGFVFVCLSVVLFGCVNSYEEKSGDTRLKSLSVMSGDAELIGDFDADTLVYAAVVPYTETAAISAEAASGAAWLGYSANVTDGVITLHEGANTVSVTVNAEDGDTRKYTVTITVAAPVVEPPKEYARLEITTQPTKTAYLIGETVDLSGLALTKVFSNGEEEAVASDAYTAEWSTWTAGTFPVTVTVDGKNAAFDITVSGTLVDTGLPVVYIDTENSAAITSKEDYVNMNFKITGAQNPAHNLQKTGFNDGVRRRGNTSYGYPQYPLRIKFAARTSLFGLTAAKSWVLLSPWQDATALTNAIAFELGQRVGLPFTNHYVHVNLVLNGVYMGNYLLTEQVQVGAGRVDIDEYDGFLVELDQYYDETPKFETAVFNIPVMVKSPEDLENPADYAFIRSAINGLETAMTSAAFPDDTYRNLIDMNTFAAFLLVNEICANGELGHPKSVYMYKDADSNGGKISMGPLWDFDWAFGYAGSGHSYSTGATDRRRYVSWHSFFRQFYLDPQFRTAYKQIWNDHYTEITAIALFIEEQAALLDKSQALTHRRWYAWDYAAETSKLKTWLAARIAYLNTEINGY